MPKIGGVRTREAFLRRYAAKLRAAPVIDDGRWWYQCRCGCTSIVRYRGRYYCPRCGERRIRCARKAVGGGCSCPLPAG